MNTKHQQRSPQQNRARDADESHTRHAYRQVRRLRTARYALTGRVESLTRFGKRDNL